MGRGRGSLRLQRPSTLNMHKWERARGSEGGPCDGLLALRSAAAGEGCGGHDDINDVAEVAGGGVR